MEKLENPRLQVKTLRPMNSNIVFDNKRKRWTPRRMVLGSYIVKVAVETKDEAIQLIQQHLEIPRGTQFVLQLGNDVETIEK